MSKFRIRTSNNDFLVNADGISVNTEQVTNDVGLLRINYDETTTMIAGFNLKAINYIENTNMNGSREYRIESCTGKTWTVMADTLTLYNGCIILGANLEDGNIQISAIYNGSYYSVIEQMAHVDTFELIPE